VTAAGARCVTAMTRHLAARMRIGMLLSGRLVFELCIRLRVTMRIGTTCGEVTALCGTGRRLLWGLRQPALRLLAVRL